jgi:hypothetical protein
MGLAPFFNRIGYPLELLAQEFHPQSELQLRLRQQQALAIQVDVVPIRALN